MSTTDHHLSLYTFNTTWSDVLVMSFILGFPSLAVMRILHSLVFFYIHRHHLLRRDGELYSHPVTTQRTIQ